VDCGETFPAHETPIAGCGGSSTTTGEQDALLAMEREVFQQIERLKSVGAPVDDLLQDVLAASAELHAFLEQQHPRAP
jgi:hypothetical protein